MTKFNRAATRPAVRSPITSTREPGLTTHEGAPGFKRDAKSELFVLAAGSFFGEGSFYESANARAERFRELVHEATADDAAWTARFLAWLRGDGNIRTAAIVGAVEYARCLQGLVKYRDEPLPLAETYTARAVIRSVLQRADEPGEMLAYYTSMYGRNVPIAVKRGIADALVGYGRTKPLYNEYTALKYDTSSHGYRFADVIELCHPTGEHADRVDTAQGQLFEWLIDRRHGREEWSRAHNHMFPMVAANRRLRKDAAILPTELLYVDRLKEAGFTWEDALSLAGNRVDKAQLWEALIPTMGYMALLRNLRNFDEAGISRKTASWVADTIADPERVRKSRQLPFRFLSAYQAAPSDRYKQALTDALDESVKNIPELSGRTLVLIDTSGSMSWSNLSGKSSVRLVDAAALFGVALSKRARDVDVIGFADGVFKYELTRGASVLREVAGFTKNVGKVGSGTRIAQSIERTFNGHDRVVVFTDMQTMGGYTRYGFHTGDVSGAVPADVPLYAWNLAGYESSMMVAGNRNRHEMGGFSDSAFKIMQTLESGRDGKWPF